MMSRDHHQPGGGEEASEDEEEGDQEARTAVAALLALTSTTEYSYTDYGDSYEIDATSDDYIDKELTTKCIVPDYEESEQLEEAQEAASGAQVDGDSEVDGKVSESQVEGIPVCYPPADYNEADEGLVQLRAFVEVTERKNKAEETSPEMSRSENHLDCTQQTPRLVHGATSVSKSSKDSFSVVGHQTLSTVEEAVKEFPIISGSLEKDHLGMSSTKKKSIFDIETPPAERETYLESSLMGNQIGDSLDLNQKGSSGTMSELSLASEKLVKDLMDDSDSDSDSDSDGDSDSDSSDSSSSGSDEDSDSDSESEGESSKEEDGAEQRETIDTSALSSYIPKLSPEVSVQKRESVVAEKNEKNQMVLQKKQPIRLPVERNEKSQMVAQKKLPIRPTAESNEKSQMFASKKEPVTTERKEKCQMVAPKKEPVTTERKEKSQKVAPKKEPVTTEKKEKSQMVAPKKEPVTTERKEKSQKVAPKKEPVTTEKKEKSQMVAPKKEPVTTEKKEKSQMVAPKKEPVTTERKEKSQMVTAKKEPVTTERKEKSQMVAAKKELVTTEKNERSQLSGRSMSEMRNKEKCTATETLMRVPSVSTTQLQASESASIRYPTATGSKDCKKTAAEEKAVVFSAAKREKSSKLQVKLDMTAEKSSLKTKSDRQGGVDSLNTKSSNALIVSDNSANVAKSSISPKEKSGNSVSAEKEKVFPSKKEKEKINHSEKDDSRKGGPVKSTTSVRPCSQNNQKASDTMSIVEGKLGQKGPCEKEDLVSTVMKLKVAKKSKRPAAGSVVHRESKGEVNIQKKLTIATEQHPPQNSEAQIEVAAKISSPEKKGIGGKGLPNDRLNSRNNSSDSLSSKKSEKLMKDSEADRAVANSSKDDDKYEGDIDDMFPMPIQAEVVMSEGSESGLEYSDFDKSNQEDDVQWCNRREELLHQSDKENCELVAYLQSFVTGGGEGELVEYPPSNNELPTEGTDLTQWQLDGVHLPPFTPNVAPPSWLRLTIPPEGYRCLSCGDTFFIESSLVQHRERRSVWINLECGPCDAKLTFYNRCALKDHLRMHLLRGEEVDEETVDVRSLPLQLTRLLQPILVPVPHSLLVGGNIRIPKSHGSVIRLPTLKPVGKGAAAVAAKQDHEKAVHSESPDDTYADFSFDEDVISPSEKIPAGMKRLSPRRRTVRCYLCERMFHSVRELMAHMRTDQPYSDQRVECRKCQLVLPSVCAAKAHILTHPPANTSNVSVCPECGSRCDGPRDFVHHLNTCGHQFRRSGIVCTVCQVCFFKSQDDFLTHWILEHCGKSYECVVCQNTFESLVFHNCQSPGQQVLATFRCLLTCPLCSQSVQLHAQEESDANVKIQTHLADCHPSIITRVHYVYKSKFCTNAFRSKDELRAHHDREHRRDNHYRTKTCTLHHEVLGYQHQYFNGQEPRNAFVTLPVALSAEELHEARIRDVPTVSSVIDKTLFPDVPSLDNVKSGKTEKNNKTKGGSKLVGSKEGEAKGLSSPKDSPSKKDIDLLDKLRPMACYRCGYMYTDNKDFRRHKRYCEGESNERQCQICGTSAAGEDFARHCRNHIQENAILCMYCNGTQFSNRDDLEQHFELHVHEQFLYPAVCAFCCASLPDVPTALTHLNEEHDPYHIQFEGSDFECNRCGRHFHGERGLSVHLGHCTLGTATPTPSATGCRQCQVCTKALTPEMFGRHMVCHLEEGLLVCSLCDGRTLPSSMALLHHLEEHAATLAYPSLCPMCNIAMHNANSALTHLKEEHGFGNLICSECDMHYNFTYQLQRHTDIVHKICLYAKRRYICWICRAYDHVKKETLMNHFRIVHGLDREQVEEKVMIRTRGQGTMPTSQFIPTKPLGSKEVPGLSSPSKGEGETSMKLQKEKSKTPVKSPHVSLESPDQPNDKVVQLNNSLQSSPSKVSCASSSPVTKKTSRKKREDGKFKNKTKVLIKKLPESVLDDTSQCKKRKITLEDNSFTKKHKKKRKAKAFRCTTCGFGTNNKEKHDNHVAKHREGVEEESDGYVCSECGASFVVEPSLVRHMFFAHKVKLPVTGGDEDKGDFHMDEKDLSLQLDHDLSISSDATSADRNIPTPVEGCLTSKDLTLAVKKLSHKDVTIIKTSNSSKSLLQNTKTSADAKDITGTSKVSINSKEVTVTMKTQSKDSSVKTTTQSKDSPMKTTTQSKDSPMKTTTQSKDNPMKTTTQSKDSPMKTTTHSKDSPLKTTTQCKDSPMKTTTQCKDSPLKTTTQCKDSPMKTTTQRKDSAVKNKLPQKEKTNNNSVKTKSSPPLVVKAKVIESEKNDVKSESLSNDDHKSGSDAKRRKVTPLRDEKKVKEVMENLKIRNVDMNPVEVKAPPIAKRKTARVTTQKKLKGSIKVEKLVVRTEKDTAKRKGIKEGKKKVVAEHLPVKKSLVKSKASKDSTKKKTKDLKNKMSKVTLTKKRYGKSQDNLGAVVIDDHCVVCKEKFTNPVELYSHLRTHGMAFLKLGRKARPMGMEKSVDL